MAKKKTNPINSNSNQEAVVEAQTPMESTQTHTTTQVETLSKELKSLKTLNEMLLKQTVERREEVKTLLKSKQDLELEVHRLKNDISAESEMNKTVMSEFVSEEMKQKIEDLEREKVQLIEDLAALNAEVVAERGNVEEIERLKLHVTELEKCNSATEEELARVRAERRRLVEEKNESEKQMQLVLKDKGLVEEKLVEKEKFVKDLERDIANVAKEKVGIEEERGRQAVETDELKREVEGLKGSVLGHEEKERGLNAEVCALKESNAEMVKARKELEIEVSKMHEIEKKFELVEEEKIAALRELEESVGQEEVEKRKFDEVVREKVEIEKVKNEQEVVIGELSEELNNLKADMLILKEKSKEQVEMISVLESEAKQYKDDIECVTVERDNARGEFGAKVKEAEQMRAEIVELKKRIGEYGQEIESLRMEHSQVSTEKEEVKIYVSLLTEEKMALEKQLVKAEDGIESLQAKMTACQKYLYQALQMVKNMVGKLEDAGIETNGELTIDAEKMIGEIQPFEAALEAIRKAFENKKGKAEDLNRQCESLKLSVVEAQNKKKFWALLSSATTIIAAVSMAFAARVR